jgi:signal transduction histidine kinase
VRRFGFDALILVGAVEAALEVGIRGDAERAPHSSAWFAAPAIAVLILTLLARRRLPFLAPVSLWVLGVVFSFVDGRLVVFPVAGFASGLASAFLLGGLPDAFQARVGLAIATGGMAIIVFNDPTHDVGGLVFLPVLVGIVWLAGFAFRARGVQAGAAEERAFRLELDREDAERRAINEERARIARELHDVIGHSVSVMTVQASAVRRVLGPDQKKEVEALLAVEQAGREAMAEMRRLVGVLRHADEAPALTPLPTLSEVPKLVRQAGDTGLSVELHTEGEPVVLPAGLDLTAYRLVQEGLTNAIKHARASRVEVRVRYSAHHVEVEVRDDGVGPDVKDRRRSDTSGGHGLVGMRERVSIYGGQLEAGPRAERGYRLWARLPVDIT